ncbi:MAG: aconitate hydratase AcnA, partial [Planctomycetota bacterium]
LYFEPGMPELEYTDVLELDLSTVVPSIAGPKRPQDRVALTDSKKNWRRELAETFKKGQPTDDIASSRWLDGPQAEGNDCGTEGVPVSMAGQTGEVEHFNLHHGDIVIAAITSCTNTSNPDVMIAAGLVAKKANSLGLTRKPWVKTSLAPGSKVVTEYYEKAGLTDDLEAIGFHTVGYGCTTCIGNSGPLPPEIEAAATSSDLVLNSVLSGNRNFEGRISPHVKANWLASPPLVVAYAIAGTIDIDLENEPLTKTADGKDIYLRDIWPTLEEVRATREAAVTPEQFTEKYADVFTGNPQWNEVPVSESELYPWSDASTYVQNPPFFEGMTDEVPPTQPINGARVLCLLGDSVTTDHISPAGPIAEDSPAGKFLLSKGVAKSQFNAYGTRRGNDRIMTRGTFANVRVRNQVAIGADGSIPEGGWTRDFTQGNTLEDAPVTWIYDASLNYKEAGTPLVVLAGKDYGMGSSRDWAAKGTKLLGVKAVIAESYERIHRSNLVFMGVLPLVFQNGQNAQKLGLRGDETFDIKLPDPIEPQCEVPVVATKPDGTTVEFTCDARLDTAVEVQYYTNGGILDTVIRKKLNEAKQPA